MPETMKLGLLGNNIGRSRAKNLHELLGEIYGIDVTYQPMDLANLPGQVSILAELERCRDEGFRGVNVTHPYKRAAFDEVKTMPSFPAGLTSVNTVLFTDEGMVADNTDYSGCCRAFRHHFGPNFKPGRVLMLGTGGVGVAIAYALREMGADELAVADTNSALASMLISQLKDGPLPVRLAQADLLAEMKNAQGLINATPVGMFQYPGCAFPKDGLLAQSWAFDAVYTPENTEFLGSCRNRGIATLSGFALFLFQGLDAFERFSGIMPEAGEVEKVFLARYPLE
jgi:shikimate dehydrogenase